MNSTALTEPRIDAPAVSTSMVWPKADDRAFAAYESLLGQQSVESDGIHWRAVRPCFFRPLLPYLEIASDSVSPPRAARWGGFQHAVPEGELANTRINMLFFDNPAEYSLRSLDYNRRRQVRKAEEQFVIRPIRDVGAFREKAYPVYLSFYERTRYAYGAQRRDRAYFDRWAGALFAEPMLVILGGYQGPDLRGVSVSLRVHDTLQYAMYFCDTESLRLYLSDLMLHTVRCLAASCPGIRRIYTGMSRAENDRFYLLRGARRIGKPARLHLNPWIEHMIRAGAPGMYRRLCGFHLEGNNGHDHD